MAGNCWHLVTPPILTLIDDEGTVSKLRGCKLLKRLLRVSPPSLFASTGLGEVFTEALIPCLSYLPTLTPEDESVALQTSTYPALLALIGAQHADRHALQAKNSSLDRLLRTGILGGLAHAGEYVRIATLLLHQLAVLIEELGIWSAKHLKVRNPCSATALIC